MSTFFGVCQTTAAARILVYFFFLMIRRPPRSTLDRSSAASDVYKRQLLHRLDGFEVVVVHLPVTGDEWLAGHESSGSLDEICLLYTSPSPRDRTRSRMPSSA